MAFFTFFIQFTFVSIALLENTFVIVYKLVKFSTYCTYCIKVFLRVFVLYFILLLCFWKDWFLSTNNIIYHNWVSSPHANSVLLVRKWKLPPWIRKYIVQWGKLFVSHMKTRRRLEVPRFLQRKHDSNANFKAGYWEYQWHDHISMTMAQSARIRQNSW